MKFRRHDVVQHVESGKKYEVLYTPSEIRLEATNEPAYGYRDNDGYGPIWVRAATIMEDGRFILVSTTMKERM